MSAPYACELCGSDHKSGREWLVWASFDRQPKRIRVYLCDLCLDEVARGQVPGVSSSWEWS